MAIRLPLKISKRHCRNISALTVPSFHFLFYRLSSRLRRTSPSSPRISHNPYEPPAIMTINNNKSLNISITLVSFLICSIIYFLLRE